MGARSNLGVDAMTMEEFLKVPFEEWHDHLDHDVIVRLAQDIVRWNVHAYPSKTDYHKVKLWCERVIALEEMGKAMDDLVTQGIVEEKEQDNENE